MDHGKANVIVIRRSKRGEHGHHGGAWKVAYADFVTAMMAFFLVMWLTAQSAGVKAAIAGYFRDPGAFDHPQGTTMLEGNGKPSADASHAAPPMPTPGAPPAAEDKLAAERQTLSDAASRIKEELTKSPDVADLRDQIEFKITAEGLRIELVDKSGSSFFDSGSSVLRGESVRILTVIAGEIGKLTNDIVVEGHTDSRPYSPGATYSNWELSADRANAARRVVEANGLRTGQVRAVRGFADTELHVPEDPTDPRNRRVSIVVRSHAAAALDAGVHETAK
jgi:chemotaxis protein MotB